MLATEAIAAPGPPSRWDECVGGLPDPILDTLSLLSCSGIDGCFKLVDDCFGFLPFFDFSSSRRRCFSSLLSLSSLSFSSLILRRLIVNEHGLVSHVTQLSTKFKHLLFSLFLAPLKPNAVYLLLLLRVKSLILVFTHIQQCLDPCHLSFLFFLFLRWWWKITHPFI